VEIALPEGAALSSGKPREEIGQLEGRHLTAVSATPWGISAATADRAKVEWVIHAPNGGSAQLVAKHDRAGVVRVEITLK
jgi:hypothetical protein